MSSTVSPVDVLRRYKVVAVVGASKNPEKEAHTVPAYLKDHGYRIIPINPTTDSVLDEKAYKSLSEVPLELAKQVEVVDVFRPSEELPEVARQVADLKKRTGKDVIFWAQLGLEHQDAKKILADNGIEYVMDACMMALHRSNLS